MGEADLADVAGAEEEKPTWSVAQFAEELRQPRAWQLVARLVESGDFAGSICCRSVAGEAEIVKFAVTTGMRRRGVGGALLSAALRRMATEEVESCFLDVRKSNSPAIALYRKYLFCQVGVRRNYYASPVEDALIFKLTIGGAR